MSQFQIDPVLCPNQIDRLLENLLGNASSFDAHEIKDLEWM